MASDPFDIIADRAEPTDGHETMSRATVAAYRREWHAFERWCSDLEYQPLPASAATVRHYLTAQAESFSMSTLYRKVAAVACAHGLAGEPSPTRSPVVVGALRQIRSRKSGDRATKAALMSEDIRVLVDVLPVNLLGERDRCLILLGFATGLLRSELVRLNCDDIADSGDGIVIQVDSRGRMDRRQPIRIPLADEPAVCPVRAFRAWIASSGITSGPLFRWVTRYGRVRNSRLSDKSVALIIKRAVVAAGRDPNAYSSRSLRGAALRRPPRREDPLTP